MQKLIAPILILLLALPGCATQHEPTWDTTVVDDEEQYMPYLEQGTANLTGQAFLLQRGGGVVKAAGRTVTLDPATATGIEWWSKSNWQYRELTPPSPGFNKARRTTMADAEGKFKFKNLPAGTYYLRTEVTWEAGGDIQGGLVGRLIEVKNSQDNEFILNGFMQ